MSSKLVNHSLPHDIYIGRPSKFGNPFIIGKDGTRSEVIKKYHDWIITQPKLLEQLSELEGKILACWCQPEKEACHGHVLLKLLDERRKKLFLDDAFE